MYKILFPVFLLACTTVQNNPDAAIDMPDASGVNVADAMAPADAMREWPASGTRIRARIATTPDGAQAHLGWFDTELNVTCWMGEEKCMPPMAYSTNVYADIDCTVPLAFVGTCATGTNAYRWVYRTEDPSTCQPIVRYYEVGSAFEQSTVYVLGQTCRPSSTADGSPYQGYVYLGNEIDPSIFASVIVALE